MGFRRHRDWKREADAMVKRQLAGRDITDQRVFDAMRQVPRHEFLPVENRAEAYGDHPITIPCEQTISQPYIVALTLQSMGLTGNERVLEIGTGSGYQTALLARLAGEVVSVERHAELAKAAQGTLDRLGIEGCEIICADGTAPLDHGVFDAIAVSAASPEVPCALLDQLGEGGRLIIPIGGLKSQNLLRLEKKGGELLTTELTPCRFVPLIGEHGFAAKPPRSSDTSE